MIADSVHNGFAGRTRVVLVCLLCFLFLALFVHGEKKDIRAGFENERTDPLDEKSLAFLDSDLEPLRLQAAQLAREKKYAEAARSYLALLRFNRNDATSIYNLACCYGRLRRADLAVSCLVLAARAGFRDFKLLKSDPDFVSIRATPEFIALLNRIPVWEENLGETLYVKTSKLEVLRVKLPAQFDPSRKYPLLIGLHGNGGNSEQLLAAMNNVLKKEPLILAAPQGAYANFPLLFGRHFSWEIQTRDRELWKLGDPLAVENISHAIRIVKEKYPISEVYILGFSQGAAVAFLSGFLHPEQVAGIVSIGGLFPETDTDFSVLKETDIVSGKRIRVFIAQGNRDPAIPVGLGAKTTVKLKKYGVDVVYREYEGGHEISPDVLREIYSWMVMK